VDDDEIRRLAALEDRHWWYAARRDLLRHAAGPAPARTATAVDVGSAAGGNARVLRDLGWRTYAVEPSATGAGLAKERGLGVVRADATALPFRDKSIDLVVAMDVLEHIPDDAAAARDLVRVLRPGGRAFVAVPADPGLWSGHDEAVGHQRRYTRDSLAALAAAAGLRHVEIGSWNVLLRPLVALRRKGSGGGAESDLAPSPPGVDPALRALLRVERALPFLRNRRGVSLVLTGRRPAGE
jgi:SAM-dependent methyltransferase